jgi:hypothetical protein
MENPDEALHSSTHEWDGLKSTSWEDRMKRKRQTRTVRELGGEIWAEITMRGEKEQKEFASATADIVMGVLARYDRHVILMDEDFPVVPLEQLKFDD